jgi:hypothetical protein
LIWEHTRKRLNATWYSVYVETKGKEPRVTVAVRIGKGGLAAIDQRAEQEDRTRSDMIRRLLIYAVQNMPAGWRPREGQRS